MEGGCLVPSRASQVADEHHCAAGNLLVVTASWEKPPMELCMTMAVEKIRHGEENGGCGRVSGKGEFHRRGRACGHVDRAYF